MAIYELINPSDKITFEASSDEVAAITAFAISGMFGAKRDGWSAGPWIFGAGQWFVDEYGADPGVCFKRNERDVATALTSFRLGNRNSYDGLDDAATAVLMDERRSSLSDICSAAIKGGKELLKNLDTPVVETVAT